MAYLNLNFTKFQFSLLNVNFSKDRIRLVPVEMFDQLAPGDIATGKFSVCSVLLSFLTTRAFYDAF